MKDWLLWTAYVDDIKLEDQDLEIPEGLTRFEYAKNIAEVLVDELTAAACEQGRSCDFLIIQRQWPDIGGLSTVEIYADGNLIIELG